MSRRRAAMGLPGPPQPPAAAPAAHHDPSRGLLSALTVVLLVITLLPCFLAFSPDVYLDVDPRSPQGAQTIITVITPTGAMLLHTATVVLSAAALAVHVGMSHRLRLGAAALAILGLALTAWHLNDGVAGTMRAANWGAAVCAALAMAHLAQHERPRRIAIAAIIALVIPQLIDALLYLWFEHPMTVENFLENEAQTVAARGWVFNSVQHLLFKRRLMFPDATGSFGLSNVYGSIVAAMTLLALGVAVVCAARRQWVQAAAPALAGVCGLAVLGLTHSKGAPLAAVMAMSLAPVLLWLRRRGGRPRWLPGALAILLVLMAIAIIPVRGAMGPPDSHEGERSLLFRWHYWQGAAGIVAEDPLRLVTGIGASSFKDLYSRHKNPLNPEEVTSTHQVFIDYTLMLGVGGLAWSALLVLWLWQSALSAGAPAPPPEPDDARADDEREPPLSIRDTDLRLAAVMGLALFVTQFVVQFPTQLTPEGFVGWCAGLMLFIVVMALVLSPGWTWPRGGGKVGLAMAAAALLIHGQIEMTFFHDGAVTVAWLVLGIAAGAAHHHAPRHEESGRAGRLRRLAPAALLAAFAVALTVQGAFVARHQSHLRLAADAMRVNQLAAACDDLTLALRALPRDAATASNLVMLHLEQAQGAAQMRRPEEARAQLGRALAALDRADALGLRDASLLRLRARAQEMVGQLFNDAAAYGAALAAWGQLVARYPYSMQDALAQADLLWRLGRADEARQVYARVLELDRQAYLDPAKQLDDATRAMVTQRAGR